MHLRGPDATETEVTLALQCADDPELHLPSLLEWLDQEDAFRGRLRLTRRPVQQGEMGSVLEFLAVTLGSGGAGALLVQAISTWLGQRGTDVTITITRPGGSDITVEVRRAQDPVAVTRELEQLLTPPQN
ncbi:effector-associated constant component EACC1 [Streptomyces sp. Da 82-17]|uniref:effector-associated constant component EACC1 n=1 Tax=Streptomyces sp. Da 82-17 TaxID=3377116 RepID=UPI0038D40B82